MVNTASLFSQLLREVPRHEFAALVSKHRAERNAKGFKCWTQFTAMLFCQLAHADSLREICNGLACCLGRLVHLGIDRVPSKSNLSYANIHRPAGLYEDLFWSMMERFRAQGRLMSCSTMTTTCLRTSALARRVCMIRRSSQTSSSIGVLSS